MTNSEILNAAQPYGWDESDWTALMFAIDDGACTPFLGAGACAGVLPLGREVAEAMAREFKYPFPDTGNLVRVAQYTSLIDAMLPKRYLARLFKRKGPPDFNNPDEPHRVLADLPLPVYLTTNYDDFMMQALQRDGTRRPRRKICDWYTAQQSKPVAAAATAAPPPTPDEPLVFHLHGSLDKLESMVLTEDDYLDFLMSISEERELIPPRVEDAFTSSSLLFMGYSLEDMNFKVLFRRLARFMQRSEGTRHVSVQIPPPPKRDGGGRQRDAAPAGTTEPAGEAELSGEDVARLEAAAARQRAALQNHLRNQRVKVYWGTCAEFAAELRRRWEAYKSGG